ncbi:glycosyltransferase family 4 protein [Tsuneonella sp. SYSU-LHT278]|uniref:glycosyltransferase family 4 protein n=1 Tax=Tsuneonella sediminis TaxID=3416089 RepID=UPI003F7AC413
MKVPRHPRLCVFTRAWLSSGAGLFAQELVAGMGDVGAEVTFVAPRAESARFEIPRAGIARMRPPRERRDNGPRLVRIIWSLARVVGGLAALLLARARHRIFVVTIPDPLIFSVPILALLRITGARIIFVAHDPVPHAWRLPKMFRWLELKMHESCYRLAEAVVVLSEPGREKILETFPKIKTRITVIEHGVFPLGEPTPIPGAGRLLVFGALRRNKGIRESIEATVAAAASGTPVTLVIAGEPHNEEPGYWRACEALARAHPEVIDLRIGYVPDEALERLIAECDAFLLPYSEFFSQSGVALLAASNARPLIASPVGGIGALMAEGMPASTIELPVSAESVRQAIEDFFRTSPESWRKYASNYRAETLARRAWPAIARSYCELVQEISA